MNTYLQISALVYTLIFASIYFSKKRVNTLENRAFKLIIFSVTYTIIMDLVSTVYAIYFEHTFLTGVFVKAFLCGLIAWVFFSTYYVYCISDPKQAGVIDFKDHPHKKYFQLILWVMIFIIVAMCTVLVISEVNVHVNGVNYICDGPAMDVCYVATATGIITWIAVVARDLKNIKQKKYIPVFLFFLASTATIVLQFVFPFLSIVTPSAAFITAVMFFTLENPDIHIIDNLNIVRKQAEEANQAKTDFLSSMSHEIRTPLNAIVGFGQALAREDISGTAKEEVKDILMASNTLLDIVDGILDISKIEADKIEIVNAEYSTKKLINEVTSLINARIGSKPIDFKILVDENLPPVLYGDSQRVKQIIINLLTNAVKYTQEGRILFQIKAENNEQKDVSKLTISVQDTGMGMSEEAVASLFTKYQRFDMEKNIHIEGTGLGMAITKSLLDLMNGEIKVKSIQGSGSTFTVILEQKIIHKELDSIDEDFGLGQIQAFNASGQTVLVVDDNKINLKVAERLLREYNLTIELAHSGSECIDKVLDGKKYDLIFMDIMMPKMNGIEALENLKNIVGFNMPVVALTADVISGMEEKYISKGFDGCLPKPIVEEELYCMLKKFLKETAPSSSEDKAEEKNDNAKGNVDILEINRINVAAGLELLKDMEMYNLTLEEFFNELQSKLTDLENFKNEGNMDDYAILAHALKTEARYVGCNELGDIAYEHELAGKEKNKELINEKYDELKSEANRVYDVIKRYLGV